MNRVARGSLSERRNIPGGWGHDRRRSLGGKGEDESLELDLFLKSGGGALIGSANGSDGQDEQVKLERLSIGSAKIGRSGMDDLLNADNGKHDYDWLLTPPGSPHGPSSDASKKPLSSVAPKRSSTVRSVSTTRATRLPASQSETGHSTRPARSGSVTRPSISSSNFSNTNRTSVLDTSLASVTSRPSTPGSRAAALSSARPSTPTSRPIPATLSTARPSTPTSRSIPATLSTARPSTPTSRPIPTRSSTPVRTRATPSAPGLKSGPSHGSRPSTPTSRLQAATNSISNSNSSVARLNSRPSTPTRQPAAPTLAPTTGRSPSVGRLSARNGRNSAPSSHPSSPSPRSRAPVRPVDLPDFSLDTPPNLRTKLPERPASAGRMRPGMALTVRSNSSSNSETVASVSSNRRLSLPIAPRSRFPENPPKVLSQNNGHQTTPPEMRKSMVSESGTRKPIRPAAATESTGFGRTISKKSLDMALRHMDIRQSLGGIRGASLFPRSIRSAAPKGRPARMSEPIVPLTSDEDSAENGNCNETFSGDCNRSVSYNGDSMSRSPDRESLRTRESVGELDLDGSYQYDAMLMKEDSKNTSWLHSVEDKSDQSPFDHRFEPPPEPFDPL
ncbi:mucin-2-like [Phoenix dactylifera]|uniref:Mucin-2-like n=1 Tax=Phoenix dactylifera TaxID=42345 RepID=A0A8B7CNK5_PHODC|nr:mucin-2-like [Phoenix dactylifera]